MAGRIAYYGNIVKDGLVLALDAAKKDSYPGTGTIWRDISGNSYSGSLENGPIFDNTTGSGVIVLDGTNDHVLVPGNSNTYSSNFTWQAWHYYTNSTSVSGIYGFWWSELGVLFGKNFLFVYQNVGNTGVFVRLDTLTSVYHSVSYGDNYNGFGNYDGLQSPLLNRWEFTTLTKSGSLFTLYWGNVKKWEANITDWVISNPTQSIGFGARNGGVSPSPMKVADLLMYNRTLSQSEISQNYNALKGRYGVVSSSYSPAPSPPPPYTGSIDIITSSLAIYLDAYIPSSYTNGSNTWYDLSGNNNNFTLINSVNTGSESGSIILSGNNFVYSNKNSYELGITDQATYSGWLNVTAFSPSANLISDYEAFPSNRGMMVRFNNATSVDFYVYPGNYRITYTTSSFSTNTWYNLSGVVSGSLMFLYINGNQVASRSLGTQIVNSNASFKIGTRGDTGATFSNERVSNVQVYTRALSDVEILQNYNALKGRFGL